MERSTIDKVRENLRLQQVYNVFLRYGFDIGFSQAGVVSDLRYKAQRWIWDLPQDLETMPTPVKVRLMIEELGPTYVKMGQIVSSQASVIPPEWAEQLDLLQSNVPPFSSQLVRETIVEELGKPPEELYATFEPEPFAAASTAQVHHATLHDGTRVVVKVQRPHIRTEMKADLGIMQNAAKVVSARSEQVRAIDLVGMLEQFSSSVLAELDYTGEAFNAFKLAKNMEGLPGVHVPIIYSELSTSRVLTLEFIHGVKANNIEAIEKAGLDRREIARNALRAFVKQLLIDGFFHADPHPGNVLINLQTGVVTFIDTGMVGELDVQQRVNIVQLLVAVQQSDVLGMAQVLKNLSTPFRGPVDEKAYYKDFERKVGRIMYMGTSMDFGQVVNAGLNLLREHGLRLDPNLTMAIKTLMQAEAIATTLFPEGGIVADGVQMVREELMQVVTADRMLEEGKKQLTAIARDALQQVPSLSVATASWLNQYRKGRFEVYVDTSALAKEVNKISNFGRQAVIAIILVGMIIGSAIATTVAATVPAEEGMWTVITRLAYLGYVFAMIIAAIIVLRLVWRWLKGKDADKD